MSKFDRKVVAFKNAEEAADGVEKYADYNLVAVVAVDAIRRLIFVFEKERGAGRPPKKKSESDN